MNVNNEILVKMILDAWYAKVQEVDKLISELSDEELLQEVAPGKNRGIYQLGHLTAMHDTLFRILRMCKEIFPEYANIFLWSPDKTVAGLPSIEEIKQRWVNVNIQLKKCFSQMHTNEWFERHALISTADFEKEPNRNRLNVILNRTNHMNYHIGQLILLKHRLPVTNF